MLVFKIFEMKVKIPDSKIGCVCVCARETVQMLRLIGEPFPKISVILL